MLSPELLMKVVVPECKTSRTRCDLPDDAMPMPARLTWAAQNAKRMQQHAAWFCFAEEVHSSCFSSTNAIRRFSELAAVFVRFAPRHLIG